MINTATAKAKASKGGKLWVIDMVFWVCGQTYKQKSLIAIKDEEVDFRRDEKSMDLDISVK